MDADLPRCPHDEPAFITVTEFATWISTDGLCQCAVTSDTEPRARRAWLALCAE